MSWQWRSVVGVWAFAVVCAVLVGALSLPGQHLVWVGLSFAGCVIGTLCVQLATGRKDGYVDRVTRSLAGAVVVLAVASGIFALIGLV
ncbi:hypothetical protein E3T26_07805 [Cryobacterium sp. TMT1-21]|uniref:Uncharacterized protein n=1 Tax=Cryobacterium shii TaxID=1259235 RepID=A0AAQ2C4H2_9MICO|nr:MULTISPECIES: hypothetical protein [Cryobacterium]TFC42798.1 hypothetical protein E3O49_13750 [Cryobacterium shii]TFC88999.1 hypothetical protein E3T24_01885 [Cryobacterium sp. TmT2-59]TFD11597.1 hypothetical protein E3T42_16200 [Cryobacterium sp. TMT4-10]TFD14733.1 hypothetical protein E3T26_07805 [Cryobacterium sp. TMT1-21]TFD22320.1 hypothetical protein E3T32_06960 [Cryobacterium sp. TMT2-23]